jgi:hypothetical protein
VAPSKKITPTNTNTTFSARSLIMPCSRGMLVGEGLGTKSVYPLMMFLWPSGCELVKTVRSILTSNPKDKA